MTTYIPRNIYTNLLDLRGAWPHWGLPPLLAGSGGLLGSCASEDLDDEKGDFGIFLHCGTGRFRCGKIGTEISVAAS